MHVIFGMASDSRTILRLFGKTLTGVALHTLGNAAMQPLQRPVGVLIVVKVHSLPNTSLVAAIAIVPKPTDMQRIVMATCAALVGCVAVLAVLMALDALDGFVLID